MNIEKTSILLKRIQFGRLIGAFLLINVLLLLFLVIPRRNVTSNLQDSFGNLRQQAANDQKEIRDLKTRLANLQRAQEDLKKIYSEILLPKKEGVLEIRLELEELARSMQIKRADPGYQYQDMSNFRVQQFGVSLPVEGSYRNIRRFINSIERSKHFLIIDAVDLSSEQQSDAVTLAFRLSTYLVEEDEE